MFGVADFNEGSKTLADDAKTTVWFDHTYFMFFSDRGFKKEGLSFEQWTLKFAQAFILKRHMDHNHLTMVIRKSDDPYHDRIGKVYMIFPFNKPADAQDLKTLEKVRCLYNKYGVNPCEIKQAYMSEKPL